MYAHGPAVGRVELAVNGTRWVADSARQLDYWITAGPPGTIVRRYADATGHTPVLPDWAAGALWLLTPFPGLLQTPLDVIVERDPSARQAGLVLLQAVWAVLLWYIGKALWTAALRQLTVHGG